MNSIGITGGIGSGKSYVCHILEEYGIPVFYTDAEAQKEMLENKDIHDALTKLTGQPATDAAGQLNKPVISCYIARGEAYAQKVNAIVHPAVRTRMKKWLAERKEPLAAIECALLFEAGYQKDVDYTIAVSAPEDIRTERVMKRDRHSREHIMKMMALQMPDAEKAARADAVIINDNTQPLRPQIEKAIARLTGLHLQDMPNKDREGKHL